MTKKEKLTQIYLNQSYKIDQRIKNKIEQLEKLKDLATKVTTTINGDVVDRTKNVHAMEECIVKILDLEKELTNEISALIGIKSKIKNSIDKVEDIDCKLVLEHRYLNMKPWEEISELMGFSVRTIHNIHIKALNKIKHCI